MLIYGNDAIVFLLINYGSHFRIIEINDFLWIHINVFYLYFHSCIRVVKTRFSSGNSTPKTSFIELTSNTNIQFPASPMSISSSLTNNHHQLPHNQQSNSNTLFLLTSDQSNQMSTHHFRTGMFFIWSYRNNNLHFNWDFEFDFLFKLISIAQGRKVMRVTGYLKLITELIF